MTSQPATRTNDPAAKLPTPALQPPLLFLLPGLGGDQKLLKNHPNVVPIRYLDWTDLIQQNSRQNSGLETVFLHVMSQIEAKSQIKSQTEAKFQIEIKSPAEAQPHPPPIHLAGFSIGGPLAYACALAFQAQGREVASLAILDATASDAPVPVPLNIRLRGRLQQIASFNLPAGLASIIGKLLARPAALPLLHRLQPYRDIKLPFGYDNHLHMKITMQLLMPMFWPWWLSLTRPAPPLNAPLLTAPTYIFRSQDHAPTEPEDLGWSHYCTNVKVIRVPGSHNGMLEPKHNRQLSTQLLNLAGIPTHPHEIT